MVKPDFDVTFITASEAVLRYTIRGFRELCGPEVSPSCYLLNLPWRILVMPWATQDDDMRWSRRYMSYFLQCSMEKRYSNWFCYVIGELDLLRVDKDTEPFRRRIKHSFNTREDNFGYNRYILWDEILDPAKGFIQDDAITLQLHLMIETPPSGSIWYNWGNLTGRICIPKKKKFQSQQMISESSNKQSSFKNEKAKLTALQKFKELFKRTELVKKL